MTAPLWIEQEGDGPLMAVAIHAGHEVRGDLLPLLAIDAIDRAREEDAYTDYWARVAPTWLVPTQSRFETDLNRDREDSVYLSPEVAWGLRVWNGDPEPSVIDRSLQEYDAFYEELERLMTRMAERFETFVVFDLHSYNHRRDGPYSAPSDSSESPEVNVGTGSLDRRSCGRLVDRFIHDLRNFDFLGRRLDVRENVKFRGRHLARWIHDRFPGQACVLSIEFKKFYMDEWTGVGDIDQIHAIQDALRHTVPGLLDELHHEPVGGSAMTDENSIQPPLVGPTAEETTMPDPMPDPATSRLLRFDGNQVETLVVAVDGSRYAERVLHAATPVATRLGVPIGVVRVVTEDGDRAASDDYLERLRREWPAVTWHQTVVSATTAAAILAVTDRRHGLLCLTSHGHTRIYDVVVGSVAAEISRYAAEPILFVGRTYDPERAGPTDRIVVPVDGTTASEAIIDWAARLALALNVELQLVTVVEPAPPPARVDAMPSRRHGPPGDEKTYITQLVERHRRPGLALDGQVVYDPISPATGLAAALGARPGAVVALTTRAEEGIDRLRHGSAASAIIGRSPAPVLVVPATALADI